MKSMENRQHRPSITVIAVAAALVAGTVMQCRDRSPIETGRTTSAADAGVQVLTPSSQLNDIIRQNRYGAELDPPGLLPAARILAANGVAGCGDLRGRRCVEGSEYLVFCSSDGSQWTAWVVWAGIRRLQGPFPVGSIDRLRVFR